MARPQPWTAWPHAAHSRLIRVRPHIWHVQEMGQGNTVLLLHGTSGSTHSWRDVMTDLAQDHHVIAVDLPGHGQTRLGSRHRSSLGAMAQDLQSLIDDQRWNISAVQAHSAGAALGLRLLQASNTAVPLVGINPALSPFRGLSGLLFPMAARMMAMTPLVGDLIGRRLARSGQVDALIGNTGSTLSPDGLDLYRRLFKVPHHIDGTLLMMAQWKLEGLMADLPKITVPCTFLIGENDKAVPPGSVKDAARLLPNAVVQTYPGYGHLLHEEAPHLVADQLRAALRR